jgi:glycosyltransferase involved in cell wall biosynthesis
MGVITSCSKITEYGLNTRQVAVIIATKDRPNLLKHRALNSVLKQSRLPYYLIVVDDSSEPIQPQNRSIVESLGSNDYHIKYLVNQRTHGANGAWNTAVDYLSTQHRQDCDLLFLAFLDDDEWHSDYLERCLLTASSNHCNMVAAEFNRYES